MITYDQAMNADITEFHITHAGLPCTVWHRAGQSHAVRDGDPVVWPHGQVNDCGGFFLPVFRNTDPADLHRDSYATEWHHITGVNAGDFHTADECPHARRFRQIMSDDTPPVSDRSEDQPVLSSDRDADGYDALGFDESGFDRNGYDAEGYDAEGYDADGYDRNDRNEDGRSRNAPDASDLDLDDEWSRFTPTRWGTAGENQFRQHLRELVADPDDIDNLEFCGNCQEPAWSEDLSSAAGGSCRICDDCYADWYTCGSCDGRYPGDDLTETLSGADVCESCRDSYYSYCEDCDGYYHDDDSPGHQHEDDGSCCESPQMEFTIRNDGCEPLANDTKTVISLPAGTISAEGLKAIARCLRSQYDCPRLYDVSYGLGEIGDQWQTRAGNFAKRLSRLAYQKHQAKIPPDILSQIGCIARDHSKQVDVTIDVTRDLNQSAGYFYNDGSCWWNSYYAGRCTLKTNGGFGMRSLDGYGNPTGRAWVMPLRKDEHGGLHATFNTETPDAFVVFNGYGDLESYAAPRILAHMTGWTYRKIAFGADPMYVNAGGYLVAPEEIAEKYTDGHLSLSVRQHSNLFETEKVLVNA